MRLAEMPRLLNSSLTAGSHIPIILDPNNLIELYFGVHKTGPFWGNIHVLPQMAYKKFTLRLPRRKEIF